MHDPAALDAARQVFGDDMTYCTDPYDCMTGAAAIALLTDWPQYRELDWSRIAALAGPSAAVLDTWRIAEMSQISPFTYIPVGLGTKDKNI